MRIPAAVLIILIQCLYFKKKCQKWSQIDQYRGFVIAFLFPGFASLSILMVILLFLQSSKFSIRPGEPELHPLFISAGGSLGQMNESRALGGVSAGWRNWERPWAKTSLHVLHRLGLPRKKKCGGRKESTAKSMRETCKTLKSKINTSWDLKKEEKKLNTLV